MDYARDERKVRHKRQITEKTGLFFRVMIPKLCYAEYWDHDVFSEVPQLNFWKTGFRLNTDRK